MRVKISKTDARGGQKGSALFIILIAVGLFGALTFAVTEMFSGSSNSGLDDRRAELFGNEVLDYGRVLRQKVQELRISNGCADTDISFENNIIAGYENGVNVNCQVFNPDGGGLAFLPPSDEVNDGSPWIFTGNNAAADVGNAAADLIMVLPNMNESVCAEINNTSGITNVGADTDIDFGLFTGAYNANETLDFTAGQLEGCLSADGTGGSLFFYQVLIKR